MIFVYYFIHDAKKAVTFKHYRVETKVFLLLLLRYIYIFSFIHLTL